MKIRVKKEYKKKSLEVISRHNLCDIIDTVNSA